MSNDDIIVTNLNENIAPQFENRVFINENLEDRMAQRNADSMNRDVGFLQRNKFNAGAGIDHVAASIQNRFTNPQFLMNTVPQLGQSAADGARRAAEERQAQRALEKERRDLANEQRKVQKEAQDLQKEQLKRMTNEGVGSAIGNTALRGFDWMVGAPDGGSNFIAGGNATGSNVEQITLKNGKKLNIATDTRTDSQRRADALTDIGKTMADNYLQNAIDAGLNKASNMIGYGAAKAKFAIEDMRARKAQAKLEAQQLREQKAALKQQTNVKNTI